MLVFLNRTFPGMSMHNTLLAVSLGNTRTKVSAVVEGRMDALAAVPNGDAAALGEALRRAVGSLGAYPDAPVVLASVNPPLLPAILRLLQTEAPGREVLRTEEGLVIPIGRQLDPESLVGEDRLLNAAAAHGLLKQACVVVDAGTAMTVDLVDGAGTFHGGAILPGAGTMLAALAGRTAQLPEVELRKPQECIGHNTQEALRCGAFYGLRGAVRELVEQYAARIGQYPLVVATGGDAELLFEGFELVDRLVPDLTLRGIALTWAHAAEGSQEEAQAEGEEE